MQFTIQLKGLIFNLELHEARLKLAARVYFKMFVD